MKRPRNKIAISLWAIGIVVTAARAIALVQSINEMDMHWAYLTTTEGAQEVVTVGLLGGLFLALGAAIDLLDQIRWAVIHRDTP